MLRSAILSFCSLVCVLAITPSRPSNQPTGNGTKLLSFNDTALNQNPLLRPQSRTVNWYKSPSDSDSTIITSDGLTLENILTGGKQVLIPTAKLPAGRVEYWLNSDQSKVLWALNSKKQYRHSYFASYVIQDIRSGAVTPLVSGTNPGDILYAQWSPSSTDTDTLAFVRGNDIYIWKSGNITQITKDGGPNKFNGVPDWVYEEEVISGRSAMYFSPDGQRLAYLTFDESGVETYEVPFYMGGSQFPLAYTDEHEIRYPKVNSTNPRMVVNLLDMTRLGQADQVKQLNLPLYDPLDLVIGEVVWLTDAHSKLMVRGFNRPQDHERLVVYDAESGQSKAVRSRDGTDGWLENYQAIRYMGKVTSPSVPSNGEYYLDLSDISGWQHIYLWPVNGGGSVALTSGNWEVRDIVKVDRSTGIIYFTSNERHPTESHLFSYNLATGVKTALNDMNEGAFFSASFSRDGHYYILNYEGPNVPYQEFWSVHTTQFPLKTLTDNAALATALSEYKLPRIAYYELSHPSGYNISAMLRYPATFDASKKYPILLTPYGGPGFNEVTKQMQPFNFKAYVASDTELEFATFTVDNRGTGQKGRKFRSTVNRQLGKLEAEDQVWAAEQLAKRFSWVDTDHIGIWGWSYGGYLSAKVVELSAPLISYAIATAPLQDWRLYDSIYTERYMGLLGTTGPVLYGGNSTNNYYLSSIHNATGYKTIAGKVLLQHGTGDDNVHFLSTAALNDLMVREGVSPSKFHAQFFTDSDHSIYYDGANGWLYRQISGFLWEERNRKVGVKAEHQWGRVVDMGQGTGNADEVFVEV